VRCDADLPHEEMLGIFHMSKMRSPVLRLAAIGYGHLALRVNSIFWLDGKISGRIVLSLRIDGDGARSYRIVIKGKHDKPI
jgi:hypothetical protein